MGYMGMDKELQLNLIVDHVIGDMSDTFVYENVKFNYNAIITEESIKDLSECLKESYPKDVNGNLWFPIRFYIDEYTRGTLRYIVDEAIDNGNWIGKEGAYFYSEPDRQEIVYRCAEMLRKRLKKYAGRRAVQYKIFKNGEVGFRYE